MQKMQKMQKVQVARYLEASSFGILSLSSITSVHRLPACQGRTCRILLLAELAMSSLLELAHVLVYRVFCCLVIE